MSTTSWNTISISEPERFLITNCLTGVIEWLRVHRNLTYQAAEKFNGLMSHAYSMKGAMDSLWLCLCGALVMFMQLGRTSTVQEHVEPSLLCRMQMWKMKRALRKLVRGSSRQVKCIETPCNFPDSQARWLCHVGDWILPHKECLERSDEESGEPRLAQ